MPLDCEEELAASLGGHKGGKSRVLGRRKGDMKCMASSGWTGRGSCHLELGSEPTAPTMLVTDFWDLAPLLQRECLEHPS